MEDGSRNEAASHEKDYRSRHIFSASDPSHREPRRHRSKSLLLGLFGHSLNFVRVSIYPRKLVVLNQRHKFASELAEKMFVIVCEHSAYFLLGLIPASMLLRTRKVALATAAALFSAAVRVVPGNSNTDYITPPFTFSADHRFGVMVPVFHIEAEAAQGPDDRRNKVGSCARTGS